MFDLSKKSILITGSTGHIGKHLAHGLASMGATVFVNSRTKKKCTDLANEINNKGYKAIAAPFDITVEKEIKNYINSIDALDVLVNNAAYYRKGGTMMSSVNEDYLTCYESCVVASANLIKLFEPKLQNAVKTSASASIINISSMYGMVSPDIRIYESQETTSPPLYGAAKAAIIQLTKYAACELASKKIRVNCISPGPFPSEKAQRDLPVMVEKIINKVPMGRIGNPNELVGPVAFLASDSSSYVTGINMPVDGGWTSW